MFMMRRYHPAITCDAQKTAEEYSGKIARLGSLLSLGCGALFSVPLNQCMALVLVSPVFRCRFLSRS